jgi:hypothetical protein
MGMEKTESQHMMVPLPRGREKSNPFKESRYFELTGSGGPIEVSTFYGQDAIRFYRNLFPNRQAVLVKAVQQNPLPITVQVLLPTADEPFYIFHTAGMSAAPMKNKWEYDQRFSPYAELCFLLPEDWPFANAATIQIEEPAAWPLRLLMELARFPHIHQTLMEYGFAMPNSEDFKPFAAETALSAVLIIQLDGTMGEMTAADGTIVPFYLPLLLYREELELYRQEGTEQLVESILRANGDSFLLHTDRLNVALEPLGEDGTNFT